MLEMYILDILVMYMRYLFNELIFYTTYID